MVKSNQAKWRVGSLTLTTLIFIILGIVLILLGTFNQVVSWLKTFGIAFLVCACPLVIWVIYRVVNNKIKEM